jgi:hypothetical protein
MIIVHMSEQIPAGFHLPDPATGEQHRQLNHDRTAITYVDEESSSGERLEAMCVRMVPRKLVARGRRGQGAEIQARIGRNPFGLLRPIDRDRCRSFCR